MSKIVIQNMSFHYIEHYNPIFFHVNLNLDTDWKLGLIGRNGRGKSTFLQLLQGKLKPDEGYLKMDVSCELFPYEMNGTYHNTLDVMKENLGGLRTLELEMEGCLAKGEEALAEYQELLTVYLELDGYQAESKILRELHLMGMEDELLKRDIETLSGGEKTRIQIMLLFLRKNPFVLLDEPTNHLDITGKQILSKYLQQKKGFILVSHDREFLDEVVDHILSINKTDIELEKGNYSTWRATTDQKEAFEFREQTRLVKEIKSLEKVAAEKRDWAGVAEKTKNDHGKFERSSGSRAKQFMMHAKNAESKAVESLTAKKELLKNYEVAAPLVIKQEQDVEGRLLCIRNQSFGYEEKRILEHLNLEIWKGDRIWIKGPNGSGKSTLLKLIQGEISTDKIECTEGVRIAKACQDPLWKSGYLKEQRLENGAEIPKEQMEQIKELCSYFDLPAGIWDRPLETFSGGELRKLDMARALVRNNELLLLDEPLNYMDIFFREQLEKAILYYEPTVVFVEHDERFGDRVATKVLDLGVPRKQVETLTKAVEEEGA